MVNGSKMHFIREPWTYTNLMLAANGNVGIGTDNPLQQLTITGGLGFANQYAGDKKLYSPKDGLLEWMTHDAAGDPGFAVSHQGEARVYLTTDGNSYLNGGNIGIGTTAPTHRFHVVAENAVGLFESSGEMAYLRLSTKEGMENRVEICNRSGGRLSLWNNGQDVLNITRNGNVGIGTMTPNQKLMVQGGHNAGRDPDSGLLYGGQLAIKSNACQIDFIDTDSGHDDWAIMVNGSKMHFIKEPWTYTNLVLAANGNVGIGTDNPLQQLTITGGLGFANQGAGDKKLYSPKDGLLEWMTHDAAGEHGFAVSHQGQARVYLNTNGNSYLNGGNVGIGTTTPSRNLQIGPDVDGLGFELAQHASPNVGVIRFGDNTGWKLHFGRSREIPNGELNSGLSGVLMTIKDNGNVGMGTTTPGVRLHVKGDVRVEGGDVTVDGAMRAKALQTTLYAAGGAGPLPMSNDNVWHDVGDLAVSVSISQPATALVFYQITMLGGQYLVTRLTVDNNPIWQTRAITDNTHCWSPSSLWMGTLAAGAHVIKVQYRTPTGGTNNPSGDDWQNRTLNVLILGAA